MNYRELLLQPLTLRYADNLAFEIFANPADFDIIYRLIFDSEMKVAWRAAWVCQKLSDKYPEWFNDKQFEELVTLAISTTHGGLHRGCLSILNNLTLPNPIPVELINACFDWMISPKYPIAVQALSMKLLYAICQKEPDFKPELLAYLENIDPVCYSVGFNTARKNVISLLKKK